MDKDWYSPGEIRFTVKQVLWLVQNLGSLKEGNYPPDASNYIDTGGKKRGHKAPFETAADYYIEITDRLERCGTDGLILMALETWGMSETSLARYFNKSDWGILRARKNALSYVASGPARRWHDTKKRIAENYQDFKERKKRRRRNENTKF